KMGPAFKEHAGPMPHQRRGVTRITGQFLFAQLHGAVERLLVACEPGEKVISDPHVEAFLRGRQAQHCQTNAEHSNGGLQNVIHMNLLSSSTVKDHTAPCPWFPTKGRKS